MFNVFHIFVLIYLYFSGKRFTPTVPKAFLPVKKTLHEVLKRFIGLRVDLGYFRTQFIPLVARCKAKSYIILNAEK